MKKRIFPVLLSFVLLFSLVPPAFAAGNLMTLVQETAGDPNQEFVYYYASNTGSMSIVQDHVEKIDVKMYKTCDCDFTVFSFQQDGDDLWRRHKTGCLKRSVFGPVTLYKITLKAGEKVTFFTKSDRSYIYAEQADGYDLSYSTDGKNFTDYVNDGSIYLSELVVAVLRFNTAQNGTLTMRRTDPNAPASTQPVEPAVQPTPTIQPGPVESIQPIQPVQPASPASAMPTNDALWVDGQLRNATVYKIDGSNYFKIRDLAAVLNGTGKQFSVGYDAASKSVTATTGYAYQAVGGELSGAAPSSQTAAVSNDTVIVNGAVAQNVTVYKIDGSNYFKLRDLGNALGFAVDYEAGKGMIINTAAAVCNHNWATRHVDEVGHTGISGGYQALVFGCACGFTVDATDDDCIDKWIQHQKACDKDDEDYTTWYIDVPGSPYYVVDTPAHDETYCTLCGAVQ